MSSPSYSPSPSPAPQSSHRSPKRQNSAVSSTSSGNRTIRPGSRSRSARSSSSATAKGNNTGGLFARLTGKGNYSPNGVYNDSEDDDDNNENNDDDNDNNIQDEPLAGPSDYWRRPTPPHSPESIQLPPENWRELSDEPFDPDTIEDGPSDQYWGPAAPALVPPPPPIPMTDVSFTDGSSLDSPALAVKEQGFDNAEYEKRLQDVLAHDVAINGHSSSPDTNGGGFPWHPSESPDLGNAARNGYDEAYRDIIGEEKANANNELGDEDSGVLEFPQKDDASDRTPSTVSTTPSKVKEGRPSLAAFTPSPGKRASFVHPSVSRLRSHMRTSSSTTQQSLRHPQLAHLRTPSHFSQISAAQSDVMSTGSATGALTESVKPTGSPKDAAPSQGPAFTFHPLRRLSAHLFSRTTSGSSSPAAGHTTSRKASSLLGMSMQSQGSDVIQLGKPTVMDIRGMIAIGTDRGHVAIYAFGQDVKHILGNEGSASPVTAVTISADDTYVAVGRASGNIHLYDLSNPTKPARTTVALSLRQVMSGRREGHLQGSRILHIGFVGARHTSIVTGDEHGRAFWWSLGKVIGVESNDVVRMLGSYPETDKEAQSYPSKRPTTLFAANPLPLGDLPHPTDAFSLSALLTPSKLVIVGMKPSAKTWFRKMRGTSGGGDLGSSIGCASWLRSGEVDNVSPSDPVLAYSWGKALRFLRIRIAQKGKESTPDLVEGRTWEASDNIQALQWYDPNHVLVLTTTELVLLDVRAMIAIEKTPLQTRLLTVNDFYSGLASRIEAPYAFASSVRVHRGKLFLLTKTNVQVGTLLYWNDRILARVHQGDFLGAIQVALTYYENRASGNVINLPTDEDERKAVVGKRIRELIHASLEWAFSPDRMTDDTHFSADGRGVDLTSLFAGLATSCIEACLSMHDTDFLFDEAYEHYSQVGIQGIFLSLLEPFIFSGRIRKVPPNIIQALISLHDVKGEYDLAESIIWHVDPATLDINQAITLCEAHGLWDAMIHVYTRAMQDYVAPIVKLINVVRNIQQHRLHRPSLVGDNKEDDMENMAPNAYKLYGYIETILSGLSYPSGEPLPAAQAHYARTEVYTFLFQGRTVVWPAGGDLILTSDTVEPPYPYLSLLLRFDTEAFLHAMDIAFEDSYLNDTGGAINRQSIVNLMLDVMDPEYFHPGDITFLHIFVARNLPKYPQFLFIPPSTLHRILVSLSSDPDQSTREDRQLAAEYLLSAYTPHDIDAMLALFEQAGFFRILRAAYRREGKWARLISTLLRDPESDDEVFTSLDEIIRTASASNEVTHGVLDALPQLFDLGVRQTAMLLDRDLPDCHSRAIELLVDSPHKQMAYLRCLLEPDQDDVITTAPSSHIGLPARHLYVSLLCRNDPQHVLPFLDARGSSFFDLAKLANECREVQLYEGQIWALDRQGKNRETFQTVGDVLRNQGGDLGIALVAKEEGGVHMTLQTIQSVSRMAIRLCQEHTSKQKQPGEEVEDMWLGVLHEIIELVHSASALTQKTRHTINSGSIDTIALEALRSLVQETLASLVSSSSNSLSFPRLFKRLVDASTSTSTTASKKGRTYSEFRTILTGMLDSYRAEGEMLGMTTRLVEADLFENLADLTVKRKKGWRPTLVNGGECTVCGRSVDGTEGMRVLGTGELAHPLCMKE